MEGSGPSASGLTPEAGQAEVIAFLSDPATHAGAAVERVDTHISRLFLAGDHAWKLKRALRTNYLDFSTLAQRERICRREIEVNQGAGDIYVGVTPVVRHADGLRLGGPGEPIEWLVEMRRFERDRELDRLCETGRLTLAIIERLADEVARLHRAAPETPGFGDGQDLRARIDQIADALEAAGDADLDAAVPAWRAAAHQARRALTGLIERRHRLGKVRRCHGDLHLGNVVMLGDRPTPFDAIEFNEAIASIDVLYDLALTLSDLLRRGRADLANGLLNRYLGATRDYGGLPLMPLFLSMRGAVRAMTAASRGAADEAARALAFAADTLGQSWTPRLVALGGISGTGKSTLARSLAPRLAPLAGAIVIRSDVVRKRLSGAPPETRLPAAAYAPAVDRKVLARMAFDARAALRAGSVVVLDATFLDPGTRTCAAAIAAGEGVRFDGIWLELTAGEAMRRVASRAADASDATAAVVERQAEHAARPAGWCIFRPDRPTAEVAADAGRALNAPADPPERR
jgi:aminoglycoside phosphotransferase family enzyme/predicted kinase